MLKDAKEKYLVVRTHGLASHLIDPNEIRSWVFIEDEKALFDKLSPTEYAGFFEGPGDLLDVAKIEEASIRVNSIRARRIISLSRGTRIESLILTFMSKYDVENLRRIIFSLLYGRKEEELRLLPVRFGTLDIDKLSKAQNFENLIDMIDDRKMRNMISSWLSSEREVAELDLLVDRYYLDRMLEHLKELKVGKQSPIYQLIYSYAENYFLRTILKSKYLRINSNIISRAFAKLPFKRIMSISEKTGDLNEFLDELVNLSPYRSVSVEIRNAIKDVGEPWVIEHVIGKRTYLDALRISLKGSMTIAYILMYLVASEWESQSIKTVLLGRMSGVNPEILYNLLSPPSS